MTRRRLRYIAIQAIVVCVLGAVVVLTLLRPKSNMSLSGVNGPGQTTSIVDSDGGNQHPGGQHGSGDHDGGGGNASGGSGNGGSGPAGAPQGAVSPAPAATVPAPIASPTPGTGGSEGGSPTEDQYADTLARLSSELN